MNRATLKRDEGSVTLWMLGLVAMLVFLAGISVDLWRTTMTHNRLTSTADSAATAGATAVDLEYLRDNPEADPILDPGLAIARACAYVIENRPALGGCPGANIQVAPVAGSVTVTVRQDVELSLLKLLMPGEPPIAVQAIGTATAERNRSLP